MPKSETPPTPKGTTPKAPPKIVSSPLGGRIGENHATTSTGGTASFVDNAQFPGLFRNEQSGMTQLDYNTWLQALPRTAPDQWALIQAGGGAMQELLWRAYADNTPANQVLNSIAAKFPAVFDKITAANKGGGGGSRGGGGGGGTAAPTPEQIASAKAEIANRSATLGHAPLTDDVLTFVATTVVRDNWTSAQLDDWLLAKSEDITQPGLVNVSIDQIRQLASDQLLGVSDDTARGWAMKINSSEMDINSVKSIFANQALQEFGWASDGIKAGLNVKDMLAPQRDRIAQELEIGADQVDLMDPKWRNMVTVNDAQTGMPRAATITEAASNARKDPGYASTTGAVNNASAIFMQLRKNFEGT